MRFSAESRGIKEIKGNEGKTKEEEGGHSDLDSDTMTGSGTLKTKGMGPTNLLRFGYIASRPVT